MMLCPRMCFCIALGMVSPTFAETNEGSQPTPLYQRIDAAIADSHLGSLAKTACDSEFLRRSYLDFNGRSPTVAEVKSFFADTALNKRAALVDKLIGSDEFNDFFVVVLDLMLLERRGGDRVSQEEWKAFLRIAISDKQPFDQIVRSILSADGTGSGRGAAKFLLQRGVETNALTRDVARTFLGRDIQCSQCHDHPVIDDYLQSEYYGIFAFLNRSYLFEDEADNKKSYVGERAEGKTEFKSVFFPDDDASQTIPRLLDGLVLDVEPRLEGEDAYVVAPSKETAAVPKFSRRGQLARLVTHPANEYFSKNIVNRLWAHMMGQGIVDPVDFHHTDNPPSHPELLKILADEFVDMNFDIREFLRQIALSETYQRSVDFPNEPSIALAELDEQTEKLSTAITVLQATLKNHQDKCSLVESRLQSERLKVSQVDSAISDVANQLEELNKQLKELEKTSQEAQKQLNAKQLQLDAMSAAVASAKKAVEALPDDEVLAQAHKQYQERADKLNEEVEGIKQSIADNKQKSEAVAKQFPTAKRELAGLKSERVGLADMVAEARGALRIFDARRTKHGSLLKERQQRLAAVKLHRDYLIKSNSQRELAVQLAQIETKLKVPESELRELDVSVAVAENEVAAQRKLVDSLQKVASSTEESLTTKAAALEALEVAIGKAKLVAEQLTDAKLDEAVESLAARSGTLGEEVATARKEAERRTVELASAQNELSQLIVRKDQLAAEYETLLATAAEQQKDLAAASSAYESAVVETDLASERLRKSWERRFAVRALKPLIPEQLAGSTIAALGLKDRFQHEADAEWANNNKDKKSEEIDEGKKQTEIIASIRKRVAEVVRIYIQLFAAPAGAPQDVFSATADQALFFANDGKVQGWLSPAEGTLLNHLQSVEDSNQLAEELYLAILSRPASDAEKKAITDYLSQRKSDRNKAIGELAWSLLLSVEFRFNH